MQVRTTGTKTGKRPAAGPIPMWLRRRWRG